MSAYRYRLVNVFAAEPLLGETFISGNPLCVFEDGRGLGEGEMMALTRQFNLSETTFLLPPTDASSGADARLRIFTPTQDRRLAEMPFAGHPTLGSAYVCGQLLGRAAKVTLEVPAGLVPVQSDGVVRTLTAPFRGEPGVFPEDLPARQVAAILGLDEADLAGPPVWVDTGIEQFPGRRRTVVSKSRPASS